ncbi:hypothetical protein BSKO_02564 [Bryopsis sp. KO-2023]|nr:hypothetical protein BSKO_02564 [Bryopsis sp. KO-2023]
MACLANRVKVKSCIVKPQPETLNTKNSSRIHRNQFLDSDFFLGLFHEQKLPSHIGGQLMNHKNLDDLVQVVMDVGRTPEAHFTDHYETLQVEQITTEDITHVISNVGKFGSDKRAGIEGTLHRVSSHNNKEGAIVGLTMRIGKPIVGPTDLLREIIPDMKSVLFLGAPGVGKTSVIRDVARVLSTEMGRRVLIVDTSNEIAGDGNIPHPIIGRARRLHVPKRELQHRVMIEAVQNHWAEVIIVDEIGRHQESQACLSVAQMGVQVIATAHGQTLENLMHNSPLSGVVGGIGTVIISDKAAKQRAANSGGKLMKKTILERRRPAPFRYIVEIGSRNRWIVHTTEKSVDNFLAGQSTQVQVLQRDPESGRISKSTMIYSPETPQAFSTDSELRSGDACGTEVSPSGSQMSASKVLSQIEEEGRRLRAEGILSKLSGREAPVPNEAIILGQVGSVPYAALKSSFLNVVKQKLPQQSEAKVASVQEQLFLIMSKFLTKLLGSPRLIGTSPQPSMNIVAGPLQDAFKAYKDILSVVVGQYPEILESQVNREAVRLVQITSCQLGTLAKNNLA